MPQSLQPNPAGSYRFLPGIEPYSSGVIADPGHEIIHVTLLRPVPYRAGFDRIDRHLRQQDRPRAALCAVELRSPAPFTREGFIEFNTGYRALLEEWGLILEGRNPLARTNVAPAWAAPSEPSLFGFSYTVPAAGDVRPTFVVAGGGDLRGGPLLEAQVVREGEMSEDALREKAEYVMRVMARRLEGLGAGWDGVSAVDVYTVHPIESFVGPVILEAAGPAAIHGIRWYHARPPIAGLEFEMDLRGVRTERYL